MGDNAVSCRAADSQRGKAPHAVAAAAVAAVIVPAPTLGFDVSVDAVGDDLVRAACPVLVDQRGPLAVVAIERQGQVDTQPTTTAGRE
jgi:hypothetical protein